MRKPLTRWRLIRMLVTLLLAATVIVLAVLGTDPAVLWAIGFPLSLLSAFILGFNVGRQWERDDQKSPQSNVLG